MSHWPYDTTNLRNDAEFETEIFPQVFWVPFSSLGKSILGDHLIVNSRWSVAELKSMIRNPYEFIQYIQGVNFYEQQDVHYVTRQKIIWETHVHGKEALAKNSGSCSSLSGALYYLLKGKFEHMGILCTIANSGVGHTFNFIRHNGFYYFIDPYVQMNAYAKFVPIETGLKKDFARTKFITGVCIKTNSIERFISYFERFHVFREKEFIYFLYFSAQCPPVSISVSNETASLVFPRSVELLPFHGSKINVSFVD